ncbi:MAG: hypothetical protein M3336_01560, partial [Chloroflexota bacterium]|nr:hypothetical protein [Chloroflexota bacterium]
RAADPLNVAFVGAYASWQNSQRLVGRDRPGPELKWRTTGRVAGGTQSIMNGPNCTPMDAQSSRGTGFRDSPANAKRHTRFFEQFTAYTRNDDGSARSLITVQDAHRDVKRRCSAPDAQLGVTDAIPRDIDGFAGGGFDDGQRLFRRAFADRLFKPVRRGPAQMRFWQCSTDAQKRYSVGWNGLQYRFQLDDYVECQDWHRTFLPTTGICPEETGNHGTIK